MNVSDSERVKAVLDEKMGYTWTDNEEEAQIVGIMACSVRQKAIDKVYSQIAKWNKAKNHRHLITFITGCILPYDKEKFLKLFDIVFNMADLPKFPEMLRQYGVVSPYSLELSWGREPDSIKDTWHIKPNYNSDWQAFIPIQNGCDKFCTYCAVPYTRGREISRPSKEIMDELKTLVDKDYKSITLLGQNVNSYGHDKRGHEISFANLLRQIGEFGKASGKDFWVYFTSPHPRDMTDEVIEVIASYPHLAKQIHLPIQSGDDKVLIRMNRQHNVEKYRRIIHSIWRRIPEATIFTDIIVGFTGETTEQFENTRKIMHEFKYNMAYIAQYSPRPGAASSRWADDVPHTEKKRRFHQLSDDMMKYTLDHNQKMIGKIYRILVTGKDRKKGYMTGLTEGRIIVRFPSNDLSLIGNFIRVKITSAATMSTEGKWMQQHEPALS
jgi:tRNA-2-methylthio-N6-dimethylallyladenosine synthase